MKLLKYEGYNLTFEPEILALKVFKKLHTRDHSKINRDLFKSWLLYIFIQTLGLIINI